MRRIGCLILFVGIPLLLGVIGYVMATNPERYAEIPVLNRWAFQLNQLVQPFLDGAQTTPSGVATEGEQGVSGPGISFNERLSTANENLQTLGTMADFIVNTAAGNALSLLCGVVFFLPMIVSGRYRGMIWRNTGGVVIGKKGKNLPIIFLFAAGAFGLWWSYTELGPYIMVSAIVVVGLIAGFIYTILKSSGGFVRAALAFLEKAAGIALTILAFALAGGTYIASQGQNAVSQLGFLMAIPWIEPLTAGVLQASNTFGPLITAGGFIAALSVCALLAALFLWRGDVLETVFLGNGNHHNDQ